MGKYARSCYVSIFKNATETVGALVDSYERNGPFGAKEIGEGSTLPILGAAAHAIANGVWIKDRPIAPEEILSAVQSKHALVESTSL